ncbi:MAG: hypothetical protein A2Y82_02610 [Candidatus Buchananbacteria bacterium RBG_13_36_9]|uniref:Uncharacterized protein n=1 Tax=Candidatus Buchananbacteria bacterium RBG_13_36_9 TaxID=1797530 RepID=A0A1G1XQX1_9BACT|nr:MAG: hypothetical protein A2Y82_02610 [Candidatus Buchananbacteria bacterium RBG_13_36_9]
MKRIFLVVIGISTVLIGLWFLCENSFERQSRMPPIKKEKIENITRIFMHEPYRYTFFIDGQNDKKEVLVKTIRASCIKIYNNVLANETSWIEYVIWDQNDPLQKRGDNWDVRILEIHIHDISQIQGAGWDHGKFGKGATNVIE